MGFSEAFLTERPQDGLDAAQSRLRKGKVLHEQLANYFKERAHIEDLYAKNITKAFQKHFVTDAQALGTFTAPWEKLNAETLELATLHGQFSLRISNEIERPLREFARSSLEWQNLAMAEANCNRIAKEFDEKQIKVTKYSKAVDRVSGKKAEAAEQKLMDYTKQLESTKSAWRLEGPVVLQKFQTVDQSRLEHLKQTISAFEAIQTDIVLQMAEMSGHTSTSVGEFDPIMDIELFSSEMSVHLRALEPQHDGVSIVSAVSHRSNGDTIGSMEPRGSNGSNGTHTRGITGGSQMSNVSYSTERSVAQSKAASIDQTRTIDAQDHAQSGSNVLGSAVDVPTNQQLDAEGFTIPPPDQGQWSDAGPSSNYDDERSETSSFSQQPKMQMEIRQDFVSESNDEARAALERVASTLKQTKTVNRRHPGRREVRSMYHSEDSLYPFQSSPLSAGFTTDSPTPPSLNSPGPRALFNNTASNPQTSTSFSPATSRASTLGIPSASSPTQSHFNQPIPPAPPLSLANGGGSGSKVPAPVSIVGAGQSLAARPESIHGTSHSAPTSPITATPSYGDLGDGVGQKRTWVASVIEKIHLHVQAGEVSRMLVTGEVILALEGTEVDPERPNEALLRLDHLQALEKCVPNPAYLTAEEEIEGSYRVDLESLSQAMQQNGLGQGQGVVVLKYQVRTTDEEAKQTMIPLLVHPAWKCEPHQTSLLINYKANAHCKLSQTSSKDSDSVHGVAQLSDLSFLVPVSGEVVNVQSRPTGVWNSESSKMLWDVDSVAMSSTTPEPHKLLARFELNPAGGASQASPTAVKFRVQGRLLSDLAVRLERRSEDVQEEQGQEEENVAFGSVRLQVQSGRYLAMA